MASAATVSFDSETPWTGCDLRRVNRTLGGRSEQYGYESGRLLVGTSYWAGTARIGTLGKSHRDLAGAIEGSLARLVGGNETFNVLVGRSGVSQEWLDSGGTKRTLADFTEHQFDLAADATVSGMPAIGALTLTLKLKPGAFVTVDHELHMAIKDQTVTNASTLLLGEAMFLPEIPVSTQARKLEFRNPYLVARVPADASVEMPHSDGWFGPWAIAFNEASDG